MAWILRRTQREKRQIFYDIGRIDIEGQWMDPNDSVQKGSIYLPKEFATKWHAKMVMYDYEQTEPEWKYEVNEYLR